MPNDTISSAFPASQQDISNLKQTATDAVNDLGSTAAVHASKAKGQLRDLAGHVQDEGSEHIDRVKASLDSVVSSARDYAAQRPLVCVGVAFVLGLFFGLSRRSSND